MNDYLGKKAGEAKLGDDQLNEQSNLAALVANSPIMKSYEAIMQQYEQELEAKTKQIAQMQIEHKQMAEENSSLSHQVYLLKSMFSQGDAKDLKDADKIEKIRNDQVVQLIKRNHETLMEKYELVRQRNESLEKMAVEKESLVNEIKLDQDKLTQKLYLLQRTHEDAINQKELTTAKLKKLEEAIKSKDEQIKTLRTQKEKFEGQCQVLSEQVTLIQQSHDDLLSKKSHEVDILSKEVSQVSMKERESKQVILLLENELTDSRDKLRATTLELDTRT